MITIFSRRYASQFIVVISVGLLVLISLMTSGLMSALCDLSAFAILCVFLGMKVYRYKLSKNNNSLNK